MSHENQLVQRTRELLIHRDRTLTFKRIAKDTGITDRFIHSFVYGLNDDYGVNRVVKLYEYITKRKLTVQ